MIRKTFVLGIVSVLFLFVFSANGAEPTQNLPYYSDANSISGDADYALERCKLDVYRPDSISENAPVVVWFHGGGLSGGGKHVPAEFQNHKFLVVSVNYRLRPKAKSTEILEDAAAAVAWTFENIAKFGGDPRKIFVSGHSAGGYLSAMLALDPSWLAKFGKSNRDLAAALPVSGQMTTHFNVVAESQGRAAGGANNPLQITEMAPLFHTTKIVPPLYLLVGDANFEWPGRVEENYLLAAMLKTVKNHEVIEIHSYEGTNHGTVAKPACEFVAKFVVSVCE